APAALVERSLQVHGLGVRRKRGVMKARRQFVDQSRLTRKLWAVRRGAGHAKDPPAVLCLPAKVQCLAIPRYRGVQLVGWGADGVYGGDGRPGLARVGPLGHVDIEVFAFLVVLRGEEEVLKAGPLRHEVRAPVVHVRADTINGPALAPWAVGG